MTRALRFLVGCTTLVLLAPASAAAQCTGSRNLALSPTPAAVHFGSVTASDFDAGYAVHATTFGVTIVPPNQGQVWQLCVQAATPTLDLVGGWAKPLSDLELSVSNGPWIPVEQGPVVLLSDRRTQTLDIRVRMRLSWAEDVPGTYGTLLTFLATM